MNNKNEMSTEIRIIRNDNITAHGKDIIIDALLYDEIKGS